MQYEANNPEDYIKQIPQERKEPFEKLRKTIIENIPAGYEEIMSYGMISYVVPHTIYPPGYHVDPKQALPFISIASQKNFIALYHMGLYASEKTLRWFTIEYPKHSKTKLDMGKSCIRFKKIDNIPYQLLSDLMKRISVEEWISLYQKSIKRQT